MLMRTQRPALPQYIFVGPVGPAGPRLRHARSHSLVIHLPAMSAAAGHKCLVIQALMIAPGDGGTRDCESRAWGLFCICVKTDRRQENKIKQKEQSWLPPVSWPHHTTGL